MGVTKIEWTSYVRADGTSVPGYTFNPWIGCTKVSPACDHCYAADWAKRTGQSNLWAGELRRTSESNWREPLKWNRKAAAAGERHRVFCASLADVFDNKADPQWRADLVGLIEQTPHLDWLLLTKRPQNIMKLVPPKWDAGLPDNVWVGTTVENQKEAERRRDHLRAVPARVRFVSYEPALGPVDWTGWEFVKWIIFGGESGPRARPSAVQWARDTRDFCAKHGIAYHHKQWGEFAPDDGAPGAHTAMDRVGKKLAGRLLDGVEHNGFPA